MAIRGSVLAIRVAVPVAMAFWVSTALAQVTMTAAQSGGTVTLTFQPDGKTIAAKTGRPYSATSTLERILSNGIRMSGPSTRHYRDADGRTRVEEIENLIIPLQEHPFLKVEIVDSVAGYYYLLDSENRVVHRLAVETKSAPAMRIEPVCANAPKATSSKMADGTAIASEPLGLKTIDGIGFCGQRMTTIHPAGSVYGNNRPVETQDEMWSAWSDGIPVLQVNRGEPNGETLITGLKDLSVSDPDPALFNPPADYRVVEETGKFVITLARENSQATDGPKQMTALTGLPFSAELVSVRQETAPDGITLSHTSSLLWYRDGKGRTRTESHIPNTPVTINDVVAGYSYTLNAADMTVRRKPLTVAFRPASAAEAPKTLEAGTKTLTSGAVAVSELLGMQTIEGYPAYGNRSTYTYPVGTLRGNDRPYTSFRELWMSPALGMPVRLKDSNPEAGETTTTMRNLQLVEPNASLFRVPDGYKMTGDAEGAHK